MNSRDREGKTALMWSIETGNKSIAKFLLKQPGIDVNIIDAHGDSALYLAFMNQEDEVLKLILKTKNVDVNCKSPDDMAVFHLAVEHAILDGDVQIVQMFLAHKDLDVNLVDIPTRATPLTVAITNEHVEVVKLILAHPQVDVNRRNGYGNIALMIALMATENLQKVSNDRLLKETEDEGVDGAPVLVMPQTTKSNLQIVKMLLAHKDVDLNLGYENLGVTPLSVASFKGHVELVKLMLAHPKLDVNHHGQGRVALREALAGLHEQVVELLLADERLDATSVDEDGLDILDHAINQESAEMMVLITNHPRFFSSIINNPNKQRRLS